MKTMLKRFLFIPGLVFAFCMVLIGTASNNALAASHQQQSPTHTQQSRVSSDCPEIAFSLNSGEYVYSGLKADSGECGAYINVVVTRLSGSGTVTGVLSDGTTHTYNLVVGKIHVFRNVLSGTPFELFFDVDGHVEGYIEP